MIKDLLKNCCGKEFECKMTKLNEILSEIGI